MSEFKLKDLIHIYNGRPYSHLKEGDIPVYGSGGIMCYVNDVMYEGEAILLPRKGTLNNIMYTNMKIWAVDTMYYAVTNEKACPYYLYRYLRLLNLSHLDSGSALPSMTQATYYDIKVKLPNIDIQQRIASALSSLDDKIELNNRINAELEAMAKMLYDYWFVQFDFPDANGKPYKSSGGKMVYNKELKREIPEGWEVKSLSDIANITMGQSPSGESYNENGEGIVFYQGSTDFGIRFPSVRQYTTQPTRFAKQGDILLSVRAPVGTFNIAGTDCCIGRGLAAINSKNNSICYLYQQIRSLKYVFDRRNVDGTTFGSITKDDLFSLNIILPNKEILLSYQEKIYPFFEKQNSIQQENQHLASLRDWLLPMLMNGQVGFKEEYQEQPKEVRMVAEPKEEYNFSSKQDQRFELWLSNQGLAARGEIDKVTLREIFDAMDEDDK
jgi:type I restriction enzyme S subunit